MLSPEALAVEIAKHLPHEGEEMSIETAKFWCGVAETLTDHQLSNFIRTISAMGSPVSMLLREMVITSRKNSANVQ